MNDAAKLALADRLAKAIHYGIISMKEADRVWIRETGEPVAWEQEYL